MSSPSLPPAQPAYIFRGHGAQIHATRFIRSNSRLVTGDADGWIVIWSLASRRPAAVWRAHEGAILTVAEWGPRRLMTHGKDNKLIVWQYSQDDESSLSTALPIDDPAPRKHPWLLYLLDVNTLNFCSFGHCAAQQLPDAPPASSTGEAGDQLLIAVPNTLSSEAVDVFHLPSQKRLYTVHGDKSVKTGMVMAVSIQYLFSRLTLVTGYESGHTMVVQQIPELGWCILYYSRPHTQPILSLDVVPGNDFYLTSGADAVLAKHPLSSLVSAQASSEPNRNAHVSAPQQGSSFTTATPSASLLSAGLSQAAPEHPMPRSTKPLAPPQIQTTPLRISKTKHSGQQSLTIRSDARILATAGWDARVRVYSVRSVKELAVLKWHKEGCYAADFAEVIDDLVMPVGPGSRGELEAGELGAEAESKGDLKADELGAETENALAQRSKAGALSVKEKRVLHATRAHWVAAGSKDGKVSLWEIY